MSKLSLKRHLQACAEKARDFTNGLVAELAQTVTDALTEFDEVKMDKPNSVAITIPATGWSMTDEAEEETTDESLDTSEYPYYYDIPVADVTEIDRAEVTIAPGSASAAATCGLCATNETLAGYIRIRSVSIPESDIAAEYWIENGKE